MATFASRSSKLHNAGDSLTLAGKQFHVFYTHNQLEVSYQATMPLYDEFWTTVDA